MNTMDKRSLAILDQHQIDFFSSRKICLQMAAMQLRNRSNPASRHCNAEDMWRCCEQRVLQTCFRRRRDKARPPAGMKPWLPWLVRREHDTLSHRRPMIVAGDGKQSSYDMNAELVIADAEGEPPV
jgi:hypothetical protein